MEEAIRSILNAPELLAHYEKNFQQLRDFGTAQHPTPMKIGGRIFGVSETDIYTEPEKYMEEALCSLADQVSRPLQEPIFYHLAIENWIYGVHFTDKVFGTDVFYKPETGMWNTRCLKTPVGSLQKPELAANETWQLAVRIAEAYLSFDVKGVFFVPPVIASPLNVAVNLYGAEFLIAMLEEPEAARHDLRIITDIQIEMHRWYREHIPADRLQMICGCRIQPPGYGQLCGCSTQLVSPALYEEFIMPLDDELLGVYPHGGLIHLCGSHGHLIPLFAKMKNLKSFQLNDRASEELALYAQGLREDQIIYLLPCDGMPEERAVEIARTMRPKMILA